MSRNAGLAVLAVSGVFALAGLTACPSGSGPATDTVQGQESAVLTDAPNVPPPLTRKHATRVVVKLEASFHVIGEIFDRVRVEGGDVVLTP